MQEIIYPSAIFDNDTAYLQFLDSILAQTDRASIDNSIAFFIPRNDMMNKKIFHDFLMETKRRFLLSQSKESQGGNSSLSSLESLG